MIILMKVNKIMQNVLCSNKTLNLDNSSEKLKHTKKYFYFLKLHCTRFLIIPLTVLNNKKIDRQKLSDYKKTIWVYISSPTSELRTKKRKVWYQHQNWDQVKVRYLQQNFEMAGNIINLKNTK